MGLGRCLLALALAVCAIGGATAGAQVPASVRQVAGVVSPLGWPYAGFGEGTVTVDGGLVFVASSTALFESTGGPVLVQRIGSGVVLPDGRRIIGVGPAGRATDGCVFVRAAFELGGQAIVRACGTTFTVAVDGGTAAPNGGVIRGFDSTVVVAGTDVVAFTATLDTGASVLLRQDGGGLVEIARSGKGSPAGGVYTGFRVLGVTATGRVGFRATVSDGPDGLFVASPAVRAVAVVGQGSPSGGSFASIGNGQLHPGGRCVFRADLSTGTAGLFVADLSGPGTFLSPLVLEGDALPIPGATIRGFPASTEPSINAEGAVAFRALIAGATDPDRPAGIFTWSGGTLATIATVRGTLGDAGTVSRLRDPVIAGDGSVVVSAVVSKVGPGLFVVRGAAATPLAVLGDPTDADTGDSRFRFSTPRVIDTAEGAVFVGQRDAIFKEAAGGAAAALVYTGQPSPLGGRIAAFGAPAVDGSGRVFFGVDLRDGSFNEALLTTAGGPPSTVLAPDRRLLGGGGILELFPTGVDALGRPASALRGAVLTAALKGARATEAIFAVGAGRKVAAVMKVGQRVGGQRVARLGTPATGPGNRLAFLAEVGRDTRRLVVVAGPRSSLDVVAFRGASTRTRAGGRFEQLGPPSVGRIGAAFRATLGDALGEGVFVARGKRMGAVALTGDGTSIGTRLRAFDDPIVVGKEIWFFARVSGGASPTGLYRVRLSRIPKKGEDAPLVEPVLLPGTPAPAPLGGVVVGLSSLRLGEGGAVSVVADVGGGARASAILQFVPSVP